MFFYKMHTLQYHCMRSLIIHYELEEILDFYLPKTIKQVIDNQYDDILISLM